MKHQDQCVAIAKCCPSVARIDGAGVPVWVRDSREEFDPVSDLNDMHEAEKVLTHHEGLLYHGHLLNMCGRGTDAAKATASQRAEAFLRTLGKWEAGS
jgi:hypothetical protein